MIKMKVLAGLVVIAILSSLSYATAQSNIGITITLCDYDLCSYRIDTGVLTMRGELHGGSPPWIQFERYNESAYSNRIYHILLSAVFEANDTNQDGIFIPSQDQYIGSLVPLLSQRNYWLNWSWDDLYDNNIIVREKENDITTALHFNYTTNMIFSHQDPETNTTVIGWSNLPGTGNTMNLEIELGVHVYLSTPNQFKIDIHVSGWEWTHNESSLVFVFEVVEDVLHGDEYNRTQFVQIDQDSNRFSFGDAWIVYAENAFTRHIADPVLVNGSQGPYDPIYPDETGMNSFSKRIESNAIFMTFENFGNETLDYETIVGVGPPVTIIIVHDSVINYSELLVTAGLISICAIVIIFYRELKFRNNNQM